MSEASGPIGQSELGANDGINVVTHQIQLWLENDGRLYERAKQLITEDQRNDTGRFVLWVEFLLFGNPAGGFDLNTEPAHDARVVLDLKSSIDRDDFRRVNWDFVRESIMGE